MAARDALNQELFHGTVNPKWTDAEWTHLGDRSAAENRLSAVSDPGSFDYTPGEPQLHSVRLSPSSRVSPHIPAEFDDETRMWRDLGHRMEEGEWEPSGDYDVYPYENIDEGGTSYYVNRSAIQGTKRIR